MTHWRIAEALLFCAAFVGGIAIQQWRFHDSKTVQSFRVAGWEIVKSARSANAQSGANFAGGERGRKFIAEREGWTPRIASVSLSPEPSPWSAGFARTHTKWPPTAEKPEYAGHRP
jgi:hypothetical protein